MPSLRQTAYKCRIAHLLNGKYVQREGWEPNYVETELGNVSRANVIGVIVGKEERNLILDDGSGQIKLQSFEENNKLPEMAIGDKVLVIGRPRLFNDQKYLNVEIIKKIDEKWLFYRKLELEQLPVAVPKPNGMTPPVEENKPIPAEVLLEKIKQLDQGQGADVDEVIKAAGIENAEKTLNMLLQEGEIFEVRPGRVKLL